MKQTVEEAEKEYAKSVIDSFGTNGVPSSISAIKGMIALGFENGAEWQAKRSPWIRVEDKLPPLNQKVIVYNGKQVYMSHRTEKDYAKDTNSFLYGLQTYNVVAWMPIPSFDEILEANKDVLQRIKEKGVKNEIS